MNTQESLGELRALMKKEIQLVKELIQARAALKKATSEEEALLRAHAATLKMHLRQVSEEITILLSDMSVTKPLPKTPVVLQSSVHIREAAPKKEKENEDVRDEENLHIKRYPLLNIDTTIFERNTLKRITKKHKHVRVDKEKKPSTYVRLANRFFGRYAQQLSTKELFLSLKRDLIKANMQYVLSSYLALMMFTTMLAIGAGVLLFVFFLFFNLTSTPPFVTGVGEDLISRFAKTFWILFVVPLGAFMSLYVYPSVEKTYLESRINQELPFATIHMSAIAGSLVEPSKMFTILIATGDYPYLGREFTKLINLITVYGYDFVTALRTVAFNSPSQKLADLLNGFATTINSGGQLEDFFDKRSQTLLFDYKIEREKYTKTSETFMDIYISLVIAAPMILMLLLMMMRVSGLGITLSTSMITLVMILGVSMINIIFLVFLQLKQPTT